MRVLKKLFITIFVCACMLSIFVISASATTYDCNIPFSQPGTSPYTNFIVTRSGNVDWILFINVYGSTNQNKYILGFNTSLHPTIFWVNDTSKSYYIYVYWVKCSDGKIYSPQTISCTANSSGSTSIGSSMPIAFCNYGVPLGNNFNTQVQNTLNVQWATSSNSSSANDYTYILNLINSHLTDIATNASMTNTRLDGINSKLTNIYSQLYDSTNNQSWLETIYNKLVDIFNSSNSTEQTASDIEDILNSRSDEPASSVDMDDYDDAEEDLISRLPSVNTTDINSVVSNITSSALNSNSIQWLWGLFDDITENGKYRATMLTLLSLSLIAFILSKRGVV